MFARMTAAFLSLALLAACGGGGPAAMEALPASGQEVATPASAPYPGIDSLAAAEMTVLHFLALASAGSTQSGVAGTLDQAGGTLTGGPLSGTFNPPRDRITLAGGGTADLRNAPGTEHVRLFQTTGTATPLLGVLGDPTRAADMPASGIAVYAGQAEFIVTSTSATAELTGDLRLVARFGAGTVDLTIDNISGNSTTSGQPASVISNAGRLHLDGATISGTGFSGGTARASGTGNLGFESSAQTAQSRGAFFGPGADEVGGTLLIDDQRTNGRVLRGAYTGE